jgi:DNA polymerase III epsilon subunit family exonuclease
MSQGLKSLVFMDTETATLRGAPFLLELGAVRVVDGDALETFQELVLPPVPIDPDATLVHGIDEAQVRQADFAPAVIERFREFVGDDWMVAHNAPFDARVLGFEYARGCLAPPPGPFLDTLPLARRHLPEAPDHKLRTLCQYLEFESGRHHRALDDAVWCWRVFQACAEDAEDHDEAWTQTKLLGRVPITVTGHMPRPPRLSARLRGIERAVAENEEVNLHYTSANGAGSTLPVLPRFLFERKQKGYLEAECLRSGLLKTYLLERIKKVSPALA